MKKRSAKLPPNRTGWSGVRTLARLFLVCWMVLVGIGGLVWSTGVQAAPGTMRIAVTDLAYEDKVREWFRDTVVDQQPGPSPFPGMRGGDYVRIRQHEGNQTFIDRGELVRFTADVRGELIRNGYELIQGKPAANVDARPDQPGVFNILERIRRGDFRGATHVLFGTVNHIDFREESNPVTGATWSHSLNLELVVEFRLIDIRTHAVIASFSAMGEGSDVRLVNTDSGAVAAPSRGKAVLEASRSLGQDTARQIGVQLGSPGH
jgi:hypothetical protein